MCSVCRTKFHNDQERRFQRENDCEIGSRSVTLQAWFPSDRNFFKARDLRKTVWDSGKSENNKHRGQGKCAMSLWIFFEENTCLVLSKSYISSFYWLEPIFIDRFYVQIGHFLVAFCSCIKTRLRAKPFLWKFVVPAGSHFMPNQTHLHKKGFERGLVLKQRPGGIRKWSIRGFTFTTRLTNTLESQNSFLIYVLNMPLDSILTWGFFFN